MVHCNIGLSDGGLRKRSQDAWYCRVDASVCILYIIVNMIIDLEEIKFSSEATHETVE